MDLQPLKVLLLESSQKTGTLVQKSIMLSSNPATVHTEALNTFDCRKLKQDAPDIIVLDLSDTAFNEAARKYQKLITCHKPILSLIPVDFLDRSRDFILPGQSDYSVICPETLKDVMHRMKWVLYVNRLYTERNKARQMEDTIERLKKEKQFLLKEVYHRVGNILQLVCSLLDLDLEHRAEEMRPRDESGSNRIRSLRRIYNIYLSAEDRGNINMRNYIGWLCDSNRKMQGKDAAAVQFEICSEPVYISQEKVFGFGVMLNELLTRLISSVNMSNADNKKVKISVAGGNKAVRVVMESPGENLLSQYGPPDTESSNIKLVRNIVKYQLDGTISFTYSHGNHVEVEFPGTNT